MALLKSSNPALRADTFQRARVSEQSGTMTIESTVNKTAILGLILFSSAFAIWRLFQDPSWMAKLMPFTSTGFIVGFIVAIILTFKKRWAFVLAPIYCVCKGVALGGFSLIMEQQLPGIVLQAILITLSVLFSLLFIYRLGLIQATKNFKLIVGSATMGIFLVYLISFIGSFFGFRIPYIHENGTIGILFSLFVVVVAALNLVMDFDFIEKGAERGAPKYMEWYAAFGLMVTLIWLYIEVLKLLSKLRRN